MSTLPLQSSPSPVGGTVLSPLSPEQLAEFQSAHLRAQKIRRAVVVALTDAWLSAIFAGVTFLSGIFSPIAFLLGAGLALIAFNSFRGAKRLKRFDLSGPKLLALNQIALASLLIVYAVYSIIAGRHGDAELSAAIGNDAALGSMLGNIQGLAWYLTLAIYGSLIVATLLAQGLTALYYASRKKYLALYLEQTPPWIISLQKAQAGV